MSIEDGDHMLVSAFQRIKLHNLPHARSFAVGVSRKARRMAKEGGAGVTGEGVYDFNAKAAEVLASIDKAMQPLVSLNEGFKVVKLNNELTVETVPKGKYTFKIDHERSTLFVASPMSGNFNYRYDAATGRWLGNQDDHDMRGLVTRDIIRHCTGLPNFD